MANHIHGKSGLTYSRPSRYDIELALLQSIQDLIKKGIRIQLLIALQLHYLFAHKIQIPALCLIYNYLRIIFGVNSRYGRVRQNHKVFKAAHLFQLAPFFQFVFQNNRVNGLTLVEKVYYDFIYKFVRRVIKITFSQIYVYNIRYDLVIF